nr:13327_t:CDS:2 [Entrophospora candida]
MYFIHSHSTSTSYTYYQNGKVATTRDKAQEIMESTDPIGEAFITNFLEGACATPDNIIAIDS